MKNRNDIGNVHFDASTNERIVDKVLKVRVVDKLYELVIRVPLTIHRALKSEDFDQVEMMLPRWWDENIRMCFRARIFDTETIQEKARAYLTYQACEMLYKNFTFAQAKAGNQVWAAAETMTQIGSKPEDDEKYNVGSGRLM